MRKRQIIPLLIAALVMLAGGAMLFDEQPAPESNVETEILADEPTPLSASPEMTVSQSEEAQIEEPEAAGAEPTEAAVDKTEATAASAAKTQPENAQGSKASTKATQTEKAPSESKELTEEPPAKTPDSFVKDLLTLINQERTNAGLTALELDPTLCSVTQLRAEECVTNFGHTRPNGSSYKTAVSDAGIAYSHVGENLASGQASPEEVMDTWMVSGGHRDNILNESYTKIGIGIAANSGNQYGGYSWTLLFTD